MPSIFVAIPSRSGLRAETATLAFVSLPQALGDDVAGYRVSVLSDCSDIVQSRSELAAEFRESGCDYLLHLDDDVSCDPRVVLDLLETGADVGVAAYPSRRPPFEFAWCSQPGASVESDAAGNRLLDIAATGLGLCLVRREVIDRLCAVHNDLRYVSYRTGREAHQLYRHTISEVDGVRRGGGEDWAFYSRCRAAGYRVRCLIDASVTHAGITDCLARRLP